jgi:hypothetical protein
MLMFVEGTNLPHWERPIYREVEIGTVDVLKTLKY